MFWWLSTGFVGCGYVCVVHMWISFVFHRHVGLGLFGVVCGCLVRCVSVIRDIITVRLVDKCVGLAVCDVYGCG